MRLARDAAVAWYRGETSGARRLTAETGVRSAVLHSPPPVLRACGGCPGAHGRPGPAVIGGPPCCQRRLDRLALLAGARCV